MGQPEIVIIDYGVGNTYSVMNAIKTLGYRNITISADEKKINAADALILPGVGAFEACISNIKQRKLDEILGDAVLIRKKPILGICVGMQLLADTSEENGLHEGLGWIPGSVKKINAPKHFPIPHVGWNEIIFAQESCLQSNKSVNPNFYFDHSYHFVCEDEYVAAFCEYGVKIIAAVQRDNIFGVQFHPEKSQVSGLKLFRSFFNSIQ